jgi:hypothetical protein
MPTAQAEIEGVTRMENQRVLGACYLAYSVPLLLAAFIVFWAMAGAGWISGDETAIGITTSLGVSMACLLLLLAIPSLVVSFALLTNRSWAKLLALIVALVNIMALPFGTILSLLTFWVFREDVKRFGCAEPDRKVSSDVVEQAS